MALITVSPATVSDLHAPGLPPSVTGTCVVSEGSATVTSAGLFKREWKTGVEIAINGAVYSILSVASTSSLTLTVPFSSAPTLEVEDGSTFSLEDDDLFSLQSSGTAGSLPFVVYPYILFRVYALQAYTAQSNHEIIQRGDPGSQWFYRQVGASVINGVINIPQITLESTVDAVNPPERSARLFAGFYYPSGDFIQQFQPFEQFVLNAIPTVVTWEQIAAANSHGVAPAPNFETYDKHQIDELFAHSGGGGGSRTVTSITAGSGLTGGTITTSGTIALAPISPSPAGTYTNLNATVGADGRITNASSGSSGGGSGTVTSITAGAGLDGGTITIAGTVGLKPRGVAGGYTNANITLSNEGVVTAASSGSSPGPGGSDFELEQFGGAADNSTDNLAAANALTAHLRANNFSGGTVRLRRGTYFFSDAWKVKHQLRIVGAGPWYFAPATTLSFADRSGGIIADDAKGGVGGDFDPGSAGLILENFSCSGSAGGFDGTCNVNGTTITRVSGPSFTSRHLAGCMITLQDAGSGLTFDYQIGGVTDGDHLELQGDYMLATAGSFLGAGGVARATDYEFDPNCVGGTITLIGEGVVGGAYTIDSVHDIGNMHVTPDLPFSGNFYSLKSGYAGVRSGVNYRINDKHGLEVRARVYVSNCAFVGFAGMGICADAGRPTGSNFSVNLDLSYFTHSRLVSNHGHGFFTLGVDSQVDQINLLDSAENRGFGFLERSFLGNTYISCHTEGNRLGSYWAGDNGLCHCVFLNCYAEDNQVGFFGHYGVTFIAGTLNNVHPFNVANTTGSAVTGNFCAGKIFTGIGGSSGFYSSGQLGAVSSTQRNLISDQGTYILAGQAGYVFAIQSNYLVLNGGPIHCGGLLYPDQQIAIMSGTGDPTTSDIQSGSWVGWKNNTTGVIQFWANNGGVMQVIGGGGGGGGTPGGSNTQLQYNSGGFFGGAPNLTWDGTRFDIGTGQAVKRTAVSTTPYNILNTDYYLGVDTSVARTLNLPNSGLIVGQHFTIADESGTAGTNNITVSGNGANINGASTWIIDGDFSVMSVIWTGTIWKVK